MTRAIAAAALCAASLMLQSCDSGPTQPAPADPVVKIASPAPGARLDSTAVTIEGSISGDGASIVKLWAVVGGVPGDTARFDQGVRNATFRVRALGLHPGDNVLAVSGSTSDGRIAVDSVHVTVVAVDSLAPLLELRTLREDTVPGASTDVVVHASDDSRVARLFYQLNGAAETEVAIQPDSAVTARFTVPLALGPNLIHVTVADPLGHTDSTTLRFLRGPGPYTVTPLRIAVNSPGNPEPLVSLADLNDAGQVVGSANGHAFVWSGGVTTDLHLVDAGLPGSYAAAINDRGQIVGYSFDRPPHGVAPAIKAWRYDNGEYTFLPNDRVRGGTIPTIIGDGGEVAGVYLIRYGERVTCGSGDVFRWTPGTLTRIPTRSGCPASPTVIRGSMLAGEGDPYSPPLFASRSWVSNGESVQHLFSDSSASTTSRVVTSNGVGDLLVEREPLFGSRSPQYFVWRDGSLNELPRFGQKVVDFNAAGEFISGDGFLWNSGRRFRLTKLLAESEWEIVSTDEVNERGQILAEARKGATAPLEPVLLEPMAR